MYSSRSEPNVDPDTWDCYRQTQEPSERGVEEIAPEEIVNAMRAALHATDTCEGICRDALELIGHTRLTSQVRAILSDALEFGVQSRWLPENLIAFR